MKLKKSLVIMVAASLLTMSLASCSSGEDNQGSAKSDVYAPTDKDTLIKGNMTEPESLDPIHVSTNVSAAIEYDLGEGLLGENQANQPIPAIATSWKISDNNLVYTFYLRKGAKWSNGEPITAEDFVYSLRRAVNPENASEVSYKLAPIKSAQAIMDGKKPVSTLGVKAINKYTLQITLDHPVYYFLSIMADTSTYPVYAPGVEKYGESFFQAGKLISNGPYELKEWVPNGHITVTKNPYYWDAKNVHIKNVKFLPITDRVAAYNAYESGRLDFVSAVPVSNLQAIKKKYGSQVRHAEWLTLEYLNFNLTKPPFKDNPKLRQALSMVINRKDLVKYVTKDGETPTYSFFPSSIEGGIYKDIGYKWKDWPMSKRIAVAKKLYKEAGYSKDHPLKIDIEYNTENVIRFHEQNFCIKMLSVFK